MTIVSIANRAPVLAAVANQTGVVGTAATLALSASDADGDALTWSATGLPAGMAINATTGVITGTPTTAATYSSTVTVSDGKGGTASRSFTWTVTATVAVPTGRYVKLEAVSEVNGNQFTTMAEFNLFDTNGTALTRTNWVVSADSYESDSPPANAIDGLPTIWHTQWRTAVAPLPHAFTVDLGSSMQIGGFKYLPRQDTSNNGQILGYNFYTSPDNVNWTLAAHGTFSTDNAQKTVTIVSIANRAPVLAAIANQTGVVGTASTLAVSATDADGDSLTYSATGLPAGMAINATTGAISGTPTTAATYSSTVTVNDGKGGTASQAFSWTVTATAVAPTARYARLEAISEVNGNQLTTMAEFNLFDTTGATISRTGWTVSVDSFESDSPATNAIDGLPTIWHTQWRTAIPPLPHAFTANLGASVKIGGFRYLPRQDTSNNGQILGYNFYTSADGVTWTLSAHGTFGSDKTEKTVTIATQ